MTNEEIDALWFKAMREVAGELKARNAELLEALWQLLDDMGDDGLCVSLAAKEQARVVYAKATGGAE